ncbi:hypothetical protein [Limnohabitans lacus]|jgi:hypothetical protein|uniref:DUF465 domain-containing protein n=1 Tax=Limnohabitans lacus TaxID=3045173 RepID=A0ABT6XAC0_9BURK|nr:hypothetical protein [Limnohabitans sp. HM2-2]MDI9235021.1 hypothetical protein [Limnohabitans sp. HM2-2]
MKIEEIIGTIKPLKPLSPADAQVDSLKRQEKQLATTVKLTRVRSAIAKKRQQLSKLLSPK